MRRIEMEVQERFFGLDVWPGSGEVRMDTQSGFAQDITANPGEADTSHLRISRMRKRTERREAYRA